MRACLPGGARAVLDLGAGTGKLTAGLLALGLEVTAVEPLEAMRALIPAPATALDGKAEAIPLPGGSVDAVLAGQAFHWFDQPAALAEIARVLRPGGRLGLLWNLMDDAVRWVGELCALFDAEDRASATPEPPFTGVEGFADPVGLRVRHDQLLDADGLVDNILSRSVVLLRPEAERAELLAAVRALAPPGHFALPYVCETWWAERTA